MMSAGNVGGAKDGGAAGMEGGGRLVSDSCADSCSMKSVFSD